MNKEDVTQEQLNALWDQCEIEDEEFLNDRMSFRAVQCPWGYIFHHVHIAPDDQQVDLELSERVLDRKTEDSFRYLIAKGKAEGYV